MDLGEVKIYSQVNWSFLYILVLCIILYGEGLPIYVRAVKISSDDDVSFFFIQFQPF